jgi:hypothetical protein
MHSLAFFFIMLVPRAADARGNLSYITMHTKPYTTNLCSLGLGLGLVYGLVGEIALALLYSTTNTMHSLFLMAAVTCNIRLHFTLFLFVFSSSLLSLS